MLANAFSQHLMLPDLWQQEAVRQLKAGRDVIVDAPTGAGKTWIFELLVESGVLKGQAVYTVPTRALANDKRTEWQRKGWDVGIVTGEISEKADAPVIVATLETQRERLLRGEGPRLLVVDEYQMLADPGRGVAYEMALALAPPETQLLLLSGSVANAKDVAEWLRRLGREVDIICTRERPVPLEEMPLEVLPRRAPRTLTGYWPRLAAGVLMSGLGPLLIFAPHRRDAERIARQIATAVPTPDKLALTREQEHILGRELAILLTQRVGVHHSGLSWQQRAGVIEPLAKAGQLRVMVATMGLAAGINFSLRSVMVADTQFFDGRQDRDIAPDELLQMFGRAGRRGLDEVGYVIVTNQSPRLADASPRYLRRTNQVDWPSLLRVMDRAGLRGDSPFAAAERLCQALFSRQRIALGFAGEVPVPDVPAREMRPGSSPARGVAETVRPDQHALFGLGPTRMEVLNSEGEWEEKRRDRLVQVPLSRAMIHYRNHLEPALSTWHFVSSTFPVGRVCRLQRPGGAMFGRECALGIERHPRRYTLTRNIRALTGLDGQQEYSMDQLDDAVLPLLTPHLFGGKVAGMVQRNEILTLQLDFSTVEWPAYEDGHGVALVSPDERTVAIENETGLRDRDGEIYKASSDSVVWAWRKLGLISEDGTPTRRGVIASRFQGGEGLAIAAALEDESYALDDLARHLANLRSGRRFHSGARTGDSERLAAACLHTYGAANYEGYLETGLPPNYGEGTAEILSGEVKESDIPEMIAEGDLERALAEWLSVLRQVTQAPVFEWNRWVRFQAVCAAELAHRLPFLPTRDLPALPAIQLNHPTKHHLVNLP